MSLRERMAQAAQRAAEADVEEAPETGSEPVEADEDEGTEGEVEVEAVEETDDEEPTEGAVDIASLVSGMTPEQVTAALEKIAAADSEPLVATLRATRETKTGQIQYDGKTPEGFVVRVWAPEGAFMVHQAAIRTP